MVEWKRCLSMAVNAGSFVVSDSFEFVFEEHLTV